MPDPGTPNRAPKVGVLHTVPALAGTFETMIQEFLPGATQVHLADASLLADARRIGVTQDVSDRVDAHIRSLVDGGAEAVLVTCSSIGEAVEAAAASAGVPVLRVDEPMAREAARIAGDAGRDAGRGGRIAVLATLEATLGPTGRLIERAAADGTDVDATVVPGAIEARESGDQARHDRLVREAAVAAAARADVVVLAQASMAAALAGTDLDVPVLTSPPGGVAALAATIRATPDPEQL
ncbi:aspartate/glutamate racemase family protein [Lysobacter korlensis]|uniref:Aspartate/glutamate racemase family protein n=1 Tax=Lysobacter korlensis TaxID=553636 RepID=A0ABV6RVX1_9GAMM